MARAPQSRAQQASAGDDFYEDEEILGAEGQGDRQEGDEGTDLSEGTTLDAGTEQEAGFGEDVDDEDLSPRSRGENRHQRLSNENRELRAERDRLLRERTEVAPPQPDRPREESQQEFEARIQLLPADERMEQRHIRWEQRQERIAAENQRALTAQQFRDAVERDRASYETAAKADRRMARFADRVEEEFQKRLRANQPVARQDLFFWLVGQQVASGKGLERAREQAGNRVDRQTVRPARGGSDVQQGRRQLNEREARAKRLENLQF